jgi:hypothetical protein
VPAYWRIDVERHSRLTTAAEHHAHGNPIATTYSAYGMMVFETVDPTGAAPMHGTITVARDTGARSTFDVRILFPLDGPQEILTFECYTEEVSPTPARWQCRALVLEASEGDVTSFTVPTAFARVDHPVEQEACSVFVLPPDGDAEESEEPAEPAE